MAPRGKVVLARINDDKKRREASRKRQSGLLKKVMELTTLCDAEAAVVLYSPENVQPTVWPSSSEARATISKFLSRPEMERMASTHTPKSFAEQKCRKVKKKAERLVKMNDEGNTRALIRSVYDGKTRVQDLDSEQKKKVSDYAEKRKKELLRQVQKIKGKEQQTTSYQPMPMPMPPNAARGLYINGPAGGSNSPLPVAAANYSQLTNVRATNGHNNNRTAASDQETILGGNKLNTTGLYGNTSLDSIMPHHMPMELPCRLGLPLLPVPPMIYDASGMNDPRMTRLTSHIPSSSTIISVDTTDKFLTNPSTRALAEGGNFGERIQHTFRPSLPVELPHRLGLPPVNPPMIYDASGVNDPRMPRLASSHPRSSTIISVDTTDKLFSTNSSTRALIEDGNFGERIIQRTIFHPSLPLELPRRLGLPPVLSPMIYDENASGMNDGRMTRLVSHLPSSTPIFGLDTTDNFFSTNASTRTLFEGGQFGERIQPTFHPCLPLELPRRLGLPVPVPPIMNYDASPIVNITNENRWNTCEFQEPAIARHNQRNVGNATWDDFDT